MITVDFDLISKIRLHINRTEKQAMLLSIRKKWLQLTSALDTLEDTSWAVEYYIFSDYPDSMKGKYLYTYGLLQALFVQMDAIKSIWDSLFNSALSFKDEFPEAYKVREIRDDVTGHPTSRRGHQFIHLAQCSMEKDGFYYIKTDSKTNNFASIDVDVLSAIENVAKCVNAILEKSVSDLDEEFKSYINLHRDRKMKEIFNTLGYAKEKALLDTHMVDWGYAATKEMVEKCEDELVKRYGSVDAVDSYNYLLQSIHELYELIDLGIERIPSDLQASVRHALLENLFAKLEELKEYCAETDEYFKTYVNK